MIKRRDLLNFSMSLALAATIPSLLSSSQKKYLSPIRKRSLPFYLGWYDFVANPAAPGQVSSKGIDLILPYLDVSPKPLMEKSSQEKIAVFLDAAKVANLKVLVEIYRPLIELENISGVKSFINSYKNHPSVLGWYLYDEPEIKKPQPLSPDSLARSYRAIKEADRSKPVAIAFAEPDKIEAYSNAMDIVMWDNYPCEDGISEFQWVSKYQAALRQVAGIAGAKQKKFWNILQAYSGHGFKKRLPSKAEFRYLFYASILAGSDALLFWMHPWSTPAWNESVLYPTIREFRRYIPAIANGAAIDIASIENSAVEIELFSFPNSRKKLILAVNHSSNRVATSIKIDRVSPQSSYKITLGAFEVKSYEIS